MYTDITKHPELIFHIFLVKNMSECSWQLMELQFPVLLPGILIGFI